MAKPIKTILKLQIEAGKANPGAVVASSSLKPSGFSISATGKLPFPRPLSRGALSFSD